MVGLWKCDTINLPGFPIARFHNHPPHNRGFIHLVCLIAVHVSQLWITWRYCPWLNPVLRSLSVWWISLLMMWDAMSPLSQKYFTLILPVQMHLRHFYLGSLVHLFIVAMFFSSPTLGNRHDRRSQLLYLSSDVLPQYSSPDGFPSPVSIGLFPSIQPPSQSICYYRWLIVQVEC